MNRKMRGSLTVEATMVMAIVLIAILWLMQETIELYTQVLETAEINRLDIFQKALEFRRMYWLGEIV